MWEGKKKKRLEQPDTPLSDKGTKMQMQYYKIQLQGDRMEIQEKRPSKTRCDGSGDSLSHDISVPCRPGPKRNSVTPGPLNHIQP